MIQLPPINNNCKASSNESKSACQKSTWSKSSCNNSCSSGCSASNSYSQMCNTGSMMVPSMTQNTYLLASNAPRLVYQNLPILQVPYYAQSVCTMPGCKDCGFDTQSIDEYLRIKISEQLRLYDKVQVTSDNRNDHSTQNCCCCCSCGQDDENAETERETTTTEKKTESLVEEAEIVEEKVEEIIEETVEEEKTETSQTTENENYKIAYCCCGKDCHLKSFSDVCKTGTTTKFDINYVKPRATRSLTRSKSATSNRSRSRSGKSRSPSSSRPPWIPTGGNQYYNTHSARSDLMSRRHDSSTMPIQKLETISNTETYSKEQPSYYTYQTYEPCKTVIKTTIDSKTLVKAVEPSYQCYNVVSEKSLPKLSTQKSVNFDLSNNRSASYSYSRPVSASANYYNVQTTPKMQSFQPVDSTFKGNLYSKNNEIHYVSNRANPTWNTGKNHHVRIVNAGTTVIHE